MAAKSKKGGARKGAGRKPKSPEKRRNQSLSVGFTVRELRHLRAAAGDVPVSTFLREIALRFLARRKK